MQHFFICFLLFGYVYCEIISFDTCSRDASQNCDVTEVRMSPCPETANSQPCKAKKKTTSTLEFDFTPNFNATDLVANLYWATAVDLPLPGMDQNGCHSTPCPVVVGKGQSFKYDLLISPVFPGGRYNVKCLLQDKENSENRCCFEFLIKITG